MGGIISVRLKFFSGIDKELKLLNYHPDDGVIISIASGRRLKSALKSAGIKKQSSYIYFRGGGRISPWAKLKDGDEIACLKPAGGG